ncbi:MAG: oxygen-independent coproporphyrinogen III oxidase, partial [Sphingomonadales bacterium]
MNHSLLHKYGGNVPRYTSYPTAAQFHDSITAENYAGWLGEIGAGEAVSLYLHVPYCHKLCWYCACNTNITQKSEVLSRYKDFLLKELDLVARHLKGKPRLAHIHWGGGSPNMLEIDDFQELMAAIKARFQITRATENAMEIDPRLLTREKAFGYVRAGVNRASLGVQDFNPHVQKAINRIQPFAKTKDAVDWLRDAGIRGINFDLIYGLPRQSWKDILFTVDLAVSLQPDRLSVFGYAHVPWMKPHQKLIDEKTLPRSGNRLEMSQGMARRLTQHGYVQIGIDHFAKPVDPLAKANRAGTLRRNFQGYTTDRAATLIGLGASAIGHFKGGFGQNAADL